MPHSEDVAQLVRAARRDALDDFLMRIDDVADEIAYAAAENPGRDHGSMTRLRTPPTSVNHSHAPPRVTA